MVGSRVFVGGLSPSTSDRDLERFFKGYGYLREILLKNGYGFVEFEDRRDANDAIYDLNGKTLLGERVTVERARGIPRGRDCYSNRGNFRPRSAPVRTNYRVIIENIPSDLSWQDLKDYMRQCGEVTYADAHKQHRNEGVVEFVSYSDMRNAIDKLDDTKLNGRRIRVVEDKGSRRGRSSNSRSRSNSRYRRSRSRSSSKSRSRSRSGSKLRSVSPRHRRGKSRSRSNSRKKSADRSRSDSRKKSADRSKSRSRSPKDSMRSRSRKASKDRSRSGSREVSKDRSREASKDRSRFRSRKVSKDRSRSRSREVSKDRSRSRSRQASKDRSRSRSYPGTNGKMKSRSQSRSVDK